MKPEKIEIGQTYEVKFGKNATVVVLQKIDRRVNGTLAYQCENTKTQKPMVITDATRFIKMLKPKEPKKEAVSNELQKRPETALPVTRNKGGRSNGDLSGLDAAHRVLIESGRPMNAREITDAAQEKGYCELRGLTPHATISAAINCEILRKGENSRFIKTAPGLFMAR